MANLITWKDTVTFNVGDTISVHQKIVEGDKTRTQIFKGIVIGIKGHQGLKSFVVRKIATASIAVEKDKGRLLHPSSSRRVEKKK